MSDRPALDLSGVAKTFAGGVVALEGVDLRLEPGEIHALCGENGAGKSTLAGIAAGTIAPSSGSVFASGAIGLVHQHFELVGRLRVWENVVLGREPRRGLRLDRAAARERVLGLSRAYGLEVDPDSVVETLPVGIAQRVEILRELARTPAVLILDEPTAVLAPAETGTLFATLRELARGGTAILVITHKLHEVVEHTDRVTVLRAGRVVMRAETALTSLAALARAMVGGEILPVVARLPTTLRPAFGAADVRAGTAPHAVQGATFDVRGGEIVGIAGVEGNGQSALADAVAGVLPYRGEMTLDGHLLAQDGPGARIAAGIRTIPQDRRREALVPAWSIADNVALGDHTRPPLRRGFLLDRRACATLASDIVRGFDVRTPSVRTSVGSLSGGNQQKLVVGRALARTAKLVVACQPTRGIDVGAAALVHSRLIEARNAGAAVLLVSFELDEILALADRLLVFYRGAIAGEFSRDAFPRARIGELMAGAA